MILVVSHAEDDHTAAVLAELERRGHETFVFDQAAFPQTVSLAAHYAAGERASFVVRTGEVEVHLDGCRSAWYRRPQPYDISPAVSDPGERAFAYTECHEAVAGLWDAMDAFWVNDPRRDEAAGKKSFQLKVAAEVGLRIPRTVITNDPREARAFIAERGASRTVYKAFLATEAHWRETRILRAEEMALLDQVALAPVIFQEYVPAAVDLRITVVGGRCFSAAIYSQETGYPVDFRMELETVRMEPAVLPPDVEAGLHRFLGRLGISYGAIDMRRTPEGEHVFLEVNPAGQWLFVEEKTGQPITEAVAEILAEHDRSPVATAAGGRRT